MRGYPECPRCGCGWHGLACTKSTTVYHQGVNVGTTVCGCPSPFDDDYWKDGAA